MPWKELACTPLTNQDRSPEKEMLARLLCNREETGAYGFNFTFNTFFPSWSQTPALILSKKITVSSSSCLFKPQGLVLLSGDRCGAMREAQYELVFKSPACAHAVPRASNAHPVIVSKCTSQALSSQWSRVWPFLVLQVFLFPSLLFSIFRICFCLSSGWQTAWEFFCCMLRGHPRC